MNWRREYMIMGKDYPVIRETATRRGRTSDLRGETCQHGMSGVGHDRPYHDRPYTDASFRSAANAVATTGVYLTVIIILQGYRCPGMTASCCEGPSTS
jgi:hypothetical protein